MEDLDRTTQMQYFIHILKGNGGNVGIIYKRSLHNEVSLRGKKFSSASSTGLITYRIEILGYRRR
jgi:hypothetical protein